MSGEILRELGQVNLAAAAAILLVLIVRRPVRRLFGAQAAYGLWMIPPGAMFAVLFPARTVIQTLEARVSPVIASPEVITPTPSPVESLPEIAQAPAPVDWTAIALLVWLTGLGVAAGMLALRQRRAMRDFGPLTQHPLNRRIFRAQSTVSSPALLGFLRPRIVVPADFESRFSAREQDMVLAHENAHLSAGHLWINAATALLQIINWFNPLIHIGAFFARVDQELACDAAVVERNPGERRTYAEAMLKSQIARMSLPLGCHWPARSSNLIKERVEMLARTSSPRTRRAGLVFVTLAAGVIGATAWAAQPASLDLRVAPPTATHSASVETLSLDAAIGGVEATISDYLRFMPCPDCQSVVPAGMRIVTVEEVWLPGGSVSGVQTSDVRNGMFIRTALMELDHQTYGGWANYDVRPDGLIEVFKIIVLDDEVFRITDLVVGDGETAVIDLPNGVVYRVSAHIEPHNGELLGAVEPSPVEVAEAPSLTLASAVLPSGAPQPTRTADIVLLPPPTAANLGARLAIQNAFDRPYSPELATIDGSVPQPYIDFLNGSGGSGKPSTVPEGTELSIVDTLWKAGGDVSSRGFLSRLFDGQTNISGTLNEADEGYDSYTIYEVDENARTRIDKIVIIDGQAYLIRDFRVDSGEQAVIQLPGGHVFEVRPLIVHRQEDKSVLAAQAAEILRLLDTDPDQVPTLTSWRGYKGPNALNRVQADRLLGSGHHRAIGDLRDRDELWDLPQLALEISFERNDGQSSRITVPSLDLGNPLISALARDTSIALVGRQDSNSIEFATTTVIGDGPFVRTPPRSLTVGESTRVDLGGQGELIFRLKELGDPTVDPGALERVAWYRRPT